MMLLLVFFVREKSFKQCWCFNWVFMTNEVNFISSVAIDLSFKGTQLNYILLLTLQSILNNCNHNKRSSNHSLLIEYFSICVSMLIAYSKFITAPTYSPIASSKILFSLLFFYSYQILSVQEFLFPGLSLYIP